MNKNDDGFTVGDLDSNRASHLIHFGLGDCPSLLEDLVQRISMEDGSTWIRGVIAGGGAWAKTQLELLSTDDLPAAQIRRILSDSRARASEEPGDTGPESALVFLVAMSRALLQDDDPTLTSDRHEIAGLLQECVGLFPEPWRGRLQLAIEAA